MENFKQILGVGGTATPLDLFKANRIEIASRLKNKGHCYQLSARLDLSTMNDELST